MSPLSHRKEFSSRTVLAGLAVVVLVYWVAQWGLGSVVGLAGNKVFSRSRGADKKDFLSMVGEVSSATREACSAKPATVFVFGDDDVVLPYLKTDRDTLYGCKTVREAAVTPLSAQEWQPCNVVAVWEFSKPHVHHPWETDEDHERLFGPSVAEHAWTSQDGRFGFTMYGHACAAKGGV